MGPACSPGCGVPEWGSGRRGRTRGPCRTGLGQEGAPAHPQLVSSRLSPTCRDAMPKSAIRMLFFSSSRRFSGFRSLWLEGMRVQADPGSRPKPHLHSTGPMAAQHGDVTGSQSEVACLRAGCVVRRMEDRGSLVTPYAPGALGRRHFTPWGPIRPRCTCSRPRPTWSHQTEGPCSPGPLTKPRRGFRSGGRAPSRKLPMGLGSAGVGPPAGEGTGGPGTWGWGAWGEGAHAPDGVAVAEVQRRDDLPEELPGLLGGQPPLLDQVVEELPAGHVF